MLANLKIIWQFHAHPVHQKVHIIVVSTNMVSCKLESLPMKMIRMSDKKY
jgi:hypothetical protein